LTIVTFDVETTTKNKGNPFTASNKLVSYSIKVDEGVSSFNYFDAIDFLAELRAYMQQAKMLVGFNIKFDLHWVRRYGILPPNRVRVWDCQIAEFIIMGQKGSYPSLDSCCEKYGLGKKQDKVAEFWKLGLDTTDVPIEVLEEYNNSDVDLTYGLYLAQKAVMSPAQIQLCLVMGLDLLCLEEMEFNGIKFNTGLCQEKAIDCRTRLATIEEQLLKYSHTPHINLDSGQQLSCLLYGGSYQSQVVDYIEEREYKSGPRKGDKYDKTSWRTETYVFPPLFKPLTKTEYKLPIKVVHEGTTTEIKVYQAGEDVLKRLRCTNAKQREIVRLLLARAELAKLLDTYYGKLPALLENMEWGEFLHGQYNQCVAATGRLSSSAPNMQNFSGDVDELIVSRFAD
jgi:DNA polymerase I-like protein with 3'-5' exonuclease and polymerase domains